MAQFAPVSEIIPVETAAQVQFAAQDTLVSVETQVNAHTGTVLPEEVQAFVLTQVSEKTGYPIEMLDPDLDLEADLGIDTVKQAELFAAVRTHYGIPRREDLRLVDYNTLAKVKNFVLDSLAQAAEDAALEVAKQEAAVEPAAPVEATTEPSRAEKPEIVPEPGEDAPQVMVTRRVPVPVLRPRLDLCIPTGVSFVQGDRVVIVSRRNKVSEGLTRRLKNLGVQVTSISLSAIAVGLEKIDALQKENPIKGVYYLAGLEDETRLDDLQGTDWDRLYEERVISLFRIMKTIHGEPFLVCATHMGGLFGFGPAAIEAPIGGAISGFAKALKIERIGALIKVVDVPDDLADNEIAARLFEETLRDPSIYEVGYEGEQRFTPVLVERPVSSEAFEMGEKPVFLVSGGSGGITAPVVVDLARRTQGTFYLLGRTAPPQAETQEVLAVLEDREGVKKQLIEKAATAGQKMTPSQVDQQLMALERAANALQVIQQVAEAGGQAYYLRCDVSDAQAVEAAVNQVVSEAGRVDVLLHAAGVDRSRKLESKPEEEFRSVVEIKAGGFVYLYKALQKADKLPRAILSFGSVAGRFGNSGQTDYAAANNYLAVISAAIHQTHPAIKTMVIDWSAWSQVGMASRGYIPRLMARSGIDMISPDLAAPMVYDELVHGSQGGEVVLAGSLGLLEGELAPGGGLDLDAANRALVEGEPVHVMLSRAAGIDIHAGILLEAELDPNTEPFLKDHAMNGIPLLPGVMGIEGFSVAAKHVSSVLGSPNAGFDVTGLQDVEFLAPFKFYRGEKRRITWKAQVYREAEGLVAKVVLESTLALKVRPDEVVQHFTGIVHLAAMSETPREKTGKPPKWNGAYTVGAEDIYKLYFHGPAFQVLDGVQRSGDTVLGKLHKNLPPITDQEKSLVTIPVLVELCLQTAGVWEIGESGSLALPRSIGDLSLYDQKPNGVPIYAEVKPLHSAEGEIRFDARVIDSKGHLYLELHNYRTARLPYSVEPDLLAPLRQLVTNA